MRTMVWTTLACALGACQSAPLAPAPVRSAVLVSVDTLRPDHLGCYGYSASTSPEIDRLCAESSVYLGALAHAPSTLLSHGSMFTSLAPQHHGASHIRRIPLPVGVPTLAERYTSGGFRTAGFHGGAQLAPEFGFGRGFERYDQMEVPLAAVVPEALAWLDTVGEAPFFLFLHTYDVHHPYTPTAENLKLFESAYRGSLPPSISVELLWDAKSGRRELDELDRRHIVATYDAEIRAVDAAIGALLAGLRQRGLLDRTVFALTSDHGEEFGEHGVVGWHSHTLFQELLRVPLVLRLPDGHGAGLRPAERVGLIDLAPTLLAASGLAPTAGSAGRSLLPLLDPPSRARTKAAEALARRPFLAMGEVAEGRFEALLLGPRKLYGGALFDLAQDPREMADFAADSPQEVAALSALLGQLRRTDERGAHPPLTLDDETESALRALGYLR